MGHSRQAPDFDQRRGLSLQAVRKRVLVTRTVREGLLWLPYLLTRLLSFLARLGSYIERIVDGLESLGHQGDDWAADTAEKLSSVEVRHNMLHIQVSLNALLTLLAG